MKRLRKLLQAATPGEWYRLHASIGAGDYGKDGPQYEVMREYKTEDAQLIVAMRNCLPELLDVVDAAARFIETDLIADHFNLVNTVAALDKKLEGL